MTAARSLPLSTSSATKLIAHPAPGRTGRALRVPAAARASGRAATLFAAAVFLAIAAGWCYRDRLPLTPKSGIGHALGICGGTAMLLLTLYSARKRLRFMRRWGAVSLWFRTHMILGVLGPVMVLFHCDFRLGALNSNVALGSMLLVAVSGGIGRYIYTRINHGLYGARATLKELHAQLAASADTLGQRLPPASRVAHRLGVLADRARAPRARVAGRVFRLAALPVLAMWVHRRAVHDLHADLAGEAARQGWDAPTRRATEAALRRLIAAYIAALVKEIQFSAYERLFSLWHALHIPLFVMLLLTAVAHVVAVHKY